MPVYNEQDAIQTVAAEALAVLDRLEGGGELLVIDDGSTDRTPELLASLSTEDARVRIVRHERNQGIGGYNRRMLYDAGGDWVFFISSDGEFDMHEALRFLDLAEQEGVDGVLGYRRVKRYTAYRQVVSWLFNALVLVFFGARFRDVGCLRLLRRSVYGPIKLYSQSAFVNAERLLVGRRLGARVVQVPVEHRPRLAGRGRGAGPGKVLASIVELLRTRGRWFFFRHYYEKTASTP